MLLSEKGSLQQMFLRNQHIIYKYKMDAGSALLLSYHMKGFYFLFVSIKRKLLTEIKSFMHEKTMIAIIRDQKIGWR